MNAFSKYLLRDHECWWSQQSSIKSITQMSNLEIHEYTFISKATIEREVKMSIRKCLWRTSVIHGLNDIFYQYRHTSLVLF